MNRQLRLAGMIFVLGLSLGFGVWQRQGWAAGQTGLKQTSDKLKHLFFPAAASELVRSALNPAAALIPAAPMATITVTSLGDGVANAANCPGASCRLRDAIADAASGDTINFSVTGTITLTAPAFAGNPLVISKNLTITGPGAAQLTVSGNDITNILVINSGVTAAISGLRIVGAIDNAIENGGGIRNAGNLTLTNCTLLDNQARQTVAPFAWRDGGAIYNTGTLTVTGSTLSNNFANQGGGIYNSGSLTITGGTTLSDNSALNVGGAIYNSGTLTITGSTLSNNQATSVGGGIFHTGAGPVALTNSTLSGSYTTETGGGIYNGGTGMTVTNSMLSDNEAEKDGGGMRNLGTVTFVNSTLSNNRAIRGNGGGIDNSGTLTVTGGTISGNSASDQGGGIRNLATLTVTGGMLSGNSATYGGGIHNIGTLTITASTFSANEGTGGGGLAHLSSSPVSVTNCTFSGNQAHSGGGIYNDGTGMTVTNSTLSDNEAGYWGGGIRNTNMLTLINSTLSGNRATTTFGGGYGGGISNEGIVNARNTLIAGNTAAVIRPDVGGTLTSQGYNLIGNSSGATITPTTGDQIGTAASPINPLLAPLANYGGPTQTHALLPGSPAINTGTNCVLTNTCASNNLGFNLTTDQRGAGFNRQVGSAVDVGAFESRGFTLAILSGNNQSASVSAAFTNPLRVTVTAIGAGEPVTGGQVTFTPPGSGASAGIAGNPATISGSTATSGTVTANAIIGGPYNVAASATGATSVNFSLTNINVPPTITAGAPLSRQRGSAGTVNTIATVSDGQTPVGNLVVTATTIPAGITVTSITNAAGTITANVAASCTATIGANTVVLTVTDGNSGTATANLTVNVTVNTSPTLSYAAAAVNAGSATTNSPATATDNGSISSFAVQSQGTYTGTLSVNASGVVSISNAAPVGSHTITIRATDNCSATRDASFTLTVNNNLPTITAASTLVRQRGTAGSVSTIATVSDGGTPAGSLVVTATTVPPGISVTSISNSGGTISANVAAGCSAALGNNSVVLTVTNGNSGTATANLMVNVIANTAPTLVYPGASIALGSSTTISPTIATDNGSINGYSIVSVTPAMTVAPTVNSSGVVSITNAGPFGSHTIVVRVTDNCSMTTDASFTLSVGCGTITVNPASLVNGLTFVSYTATLSATGGSASYTFSLQSGTLPAGVNLNGNMITGTPTAAGASTFTIRATDDNGCFGERTYTVNIGSTGLMYYPLARPVRLLDTRPGASPNACFQPSAPVAGGTSRLQPARGTCEGIAIPANATTITGHVTTVQSGGGFLTLYPSDAPQPNVTNSNYLANEILNNAFTVGLGASDGAFKIFVSSNTDLVVDVTGYYAPPSAGGLYFHPLPKPIRLLETRQGLTGCQVAGTPLQGATTRTQSGITTCDGVTIPTGAQALVGNATTTNSAGSGYLTLYPADAAQPFASSSNFAAGINRNAPFTVGLSLNGEFNIYTAQTTDLIIDVIGYFSTQASDANGQGLLFNSLGAPLRLLDTRAAQPACYQPGASMIGGTVYTQNTQIACTNLTPTARGLVGNVSALNVTSNGYLTFWPSNANQPTVATSNYQTGRTFNRHFTVGLGTDAAFKRFAATTTDVIVDISGFFAP